MSTAVKTQRNGASGSVSSGASGGGGSDRTVVVPEADPVNGGKRVLTETVDGIPHTYGYDTVGRLITDVWTVGGLSRTIAYSADGFGTASGNIYRDSTIVVTASQMTTLKTQLTVLALTDKSPQFYVSDLGLLLEWNGPDACFRGVAGSEVFVGFNNTPVVNVNPGAAESAALMTLVCPAWLRGPKGVWRVESFSGYNLNAETKAVRLKLNGTTFVSFSPATGQTIGMDAEIVTSSATDFTFPPTTSGLGAGMIASSTAVVATQTVTAGTDLTFTITDQLGVGAAITRTTYYLRVSYRHP